MSKQKSRLVISKDGYVSERGLLAKKYIFPPLSIFDTRGGAWQARKKAWRDLGLKSEEGRDPAITYKIQSWIQKCGMGSFGMSMEGTSIFDPVLTEVCLEWFCPRGGKVLDPFAGGSVRGVVSNLLGRAYTGVEIRPEQVDANRDQASLFSVSPEWLVGDSADVIPKLTTQYDFVFSCPPYGTVERYSDLDQDLSTQAGTNSHDQHYLTIINAAVRCLKDNRFAVWVVGDYREKSGWYKDYRGLTIQAFEQAGAHFYNELILLPALGNAGARCERPFIGSRKVTKTHQFVLVFCKGNTKAATAAALQDAPEQLGYAPLNLST